MSELAAVSAAKSLMGLSGSSELTVRNLFRFSASWKNDTAAATTTAIAEQVAHRVKQKSRLVGIAFLGAAAVTAGATNFFSLVIRKRTTAAPATPVALATYAADTTTTDDAVAFGTKDLYTTTYLAGGAAPGTDFNFLEGDVVTVEVTKAGTGMTFPIADVEFIFEARD